MNLPSRNFPFPKASFVSILISSQPPGQLLPIANWPSHSLYYNLPETPHSYWTKLSHIIKAWPGLNFMVLTLPSRWALCPLVTLNWCSSPMSPVTWHICASSGEIFYLKHHFPSVCLPSCCYPWNLSDSISSWSPSFRPPCLQTPSAFPDSSRRHSEVTADLDCLDIPVPPCFRNAHHS